MLLISFIANPCPSPPTWNTFLPIARNRSSLAAKVSARPPTITDRVAAAALPAARGSREWLLREGDDPSVHGWGQPCPNSPCPPRPGRRWSLNDLLSRGTDGSNPASSTSESIANRTSSYLW